MNIMMKSEVGKGATGVLEEMLKEYIQAFTEKGEYVGDIKYLVLYDEIREYNQKEESQWKA